MSSPIEMPAQIDIERAILRVVDQLEAEYPQLPALDLFRTVDQARVVAQRVLPSLEAYKAAVLDEARILLNLPAAQPSSKP